MRFFLLILAILIFGVPAASYAQSDRLDAEQAQNTAQASTRSYQNVTDMSYGICNAINIGSNTEDFSTTDTLYYVMSKYSGVNASDENAKVKVAMFFNEHSNQMICQALAGIYPTQHVFKRAIELNVHQEALVHYFFADFVNFPIDPNALEIKLNGRATTVIDYINEMLALPDADKRYNIGQIMRLRKILQVRFNAKTAAEMTPEEWEYYKSKASPYCAKTMPYCKPSSYSGTPWRSPT